MRLSTLLAATVIGLSFCNTSVAKVSAPTLVLIGGGERPVGALKAFVAAARPGPVVVLPWGTKYPEESFQAIKDELKALGVHEQAIKCLCKDKATKEFSGQLAQAGAVYFPGGDQNKIMAKVQRLNLQPLILKLYRAGVPVAGTSAGTAIASAVMLTGSGSQTAGGLGLLPDFILDQHFLVREREERLLEALERHPKLHGLGIDEDMSVVIEGDKTIKAIGPSSALVYLRRRGSLEKIELQDGQQITLD